MAAGRSTASPTLTQQYAAQVGVRPVYDLLADYLHDHWR
ncbi:MAG: hypothetical protein RLZZ387_5641, partial [Chloroflexota bacterium]